MNNQIKNFYHFEGWEQVNGIWQRFWRSGKSNLVVTTGLNEIQKQFWTGSAYTAALFVGIIDDAGFSAIALTDTAAQIGGSNGWAEFTGYSETTRQALTMGTPTAGVLDSSMSPAIFTCTANFTLNGAFVITNNTKAGTSGILIGAASAPSTRAFLIGQQVRVTVSSSLSN